MKNEIKRTPVTNLVKVAPNSPAYPILLMQAQELEPLTPLYLRSILKQMGQNLQRDYNQSDLVDTEGLAAHLHLQTKTVRKMAKNRQIPFIKIPPRSPRGKMLFNIRDVDNALTNQVVNRGRPRKDIYGEK